MLLRYGPGPGAPKAVEFPCVRVWRKEKKQTMRLQCAPAGFQESPSVPHVFDDMRGTEHIERLIKLIMLQESNLRIESACSSRFNRGAAGFQQEDIRTPFVSNLLGQPPIGAADFDESKAAGR